jgi:7-carboxy-7-deazaguanine synthase
MKYNVVEIFDSVQGEGINMGRVCTFIRLANCNLNCSWCDTNYEAVAEKEVSEIGLMAKQDLIVITGGEPLLQELGPLLNFFKVQGKEIAIETNGTLSVKKYKDYLDCISCSPKPDAQYEIHPDNFEYVTEFKYVVDENFTIENVDGRLLDSSNKVVWLQPEANTFKTSVEKAFKMCKEFGILRLGIQAHKTWEVE